MNLSLSGSALTELLQKGTGCPGYGGWTVGAGQSPGRYGRGGKPHSPGRKFFGNQGREKYGFPSFRDALGLRGNDRHTDLSGQMDFIEKNELGMIPLQKKIFRTKIGKKSGMILTTGPTGSGKTSTLYAALKLVCRPEISVISVEDPVEYRIPGITQVEVNEKAGLTFEKGLRSLVRQDPDVVMIGEIRESGNGGNGRTCRSYRASCPVYASYERCRIGACPPDRYGHSAVPAFRVAVPHHFSKACEKTLSRLPEGNGHYKRNGGRKVVS